MVQSGLSSPCDRSGEDLYEEIPLSELRAGTVLARPIYEGRGDHRVLLLTGGVTVTHNLDGSSKSPNSHEFGYDPPDSL
jgi:hypothetical protein